MPYKIGTRVEIEDEQFTSAEAEAATLVSQVTQRDWLRRGLIHPGRRGGRTAFRGIDLAELIILRELTSHGMFVATAVDIAVLGASVVMTFAGRASGPAETACGLGMHGHEVCRFLIIPNDGDASRCNEPSEWFARRDAEQKPASALVLDCRALGEELARRLPRPLFRTKRSEPE
ncbi:MerR family transcriptional regulator [Xanthobacter autotrophicus]|uniref:MerR family transcriptional regulator n=1 Tax=Xanthobacter autotrophicus TaxID=280 RepID=UPI00372B7DBB